MGAITAAFYGWLPRTCPICFPLASATGAGLSFNIGRVVAAGGALCLGQFVGLFGDDYGRAMGVITLIYVLGLVLSGSRPKPREAAARLTVPTRKRGSQ